MTPFSCIQKKKMCNITISIIALKQFFFASSKLESKNELQVRDHLNKYIPIACNYVWSADKQFIEIRSTFYTNSHTLEFHLNLKGFDSTCELQVSKHFYQRLFYLRQIHCMLLNQDIKRPPYRLVRPKNSIMRWINRQFTSSKQKQSFELTEI